MTIYNLGSINIDLVYRVPHLPAPGETLTAEDHFRGLGGKGANQSVAAARAGSRVVHIGAVGADGEWALEQLRGYGVETDAVAQVGATTGQALIYVDRAGENVIVLHSGANAAIDPSSVRQALEGAGPADTLILQNETSCQAEAAQIAAERGMRVIYSAAPFSVEAVRAVLPHVSILAMNTVESEQLSAALDTDLADLSVAALLITRGKDGADWIDLHSGERLHAPAFPVVPLDTTGAGDTFAGWFAASLDQGRSVAEALRHAAAAAALQVTKPGAAGAIPIADEVAGLLAGPI